MISILYSLRICRMAGDGGLLEFVEVGDWRSRSREGWVWARRRGMRRLAVRVAWDSVGEAAVGAVVTK